MKSVEAMVQDKVKEATKEAQASLLGAFDQLMSAKLDSVQNKISDNQQKLPESQIAKIQSNILANDGSKFKKKSCEDQFKFGVKLLDSLQHAESALSRNNDPASLVAKEKNFRRKRDYYTSTEIDQIADDSDMGWKTVKEYEFNPLVEDSDDEKRLLRAEARANRRSKQQKQRKNQRRYNPYGTGYASYGSAPYGTGRWSSTATSTQPMREQSVFPEARRQGLCFLCRRSGHWKKGLP